MIYRKEFTNGNMLISIALIRCYTLNNYILNNYMQRNLNEIIFTKRSDVPNMKGGSSYDVTPCIVDGVLSLIHI